MFNNLWKKNLAIAVILTLTLSMGMITVFATNETNVNDKNTKNAENTISENGDENTFNEEDDLALWDEISEEDNLKLDELDKQLDDIYKKYDEILSKYGLSGYDDVIPEEESSSADQCLDDDNYYDDEENIEEFSLQAIYDVNNEKIVLSNNAKDYENEVLPSGLTDEEKKLHYKIWNYIYKSVPKEIMKYVAVFDIGTDGLDGMLAAVSPLDDKLSKWALDIDIEDAVNKQNKIDYKLLNENITHEFAHILTLNNTQMDISSNINNKKTYETEEGTLKEGSYLNKFYNKFWSKIDKKYILGKDYYDSEKLYEDYPNSFVSDYAATNPEEDIAESFRVFILENKATNSDINSQKINFFYDYKELIELRSKIRNNIGLK
ncbi:zinc-binding metallopeptidase [Helicovermis profundi]|uniref:Uncharacterized protein n=1 Tax=Helicovermis profundi TaxID=3065157 RepID=A0AAU9E6S4_9FIRM|nr:hypothetical protein HLPR_06880 [Clostridia bacterium S502]